MPRETTPLQPRYAQTWTKKFITDVNSDLRRKGFPRDVYPTETKDPARIVSDLLVPLVRREEPLIWDLDAESEPVERCQAIGTVALTLLSMPGQSKNPRFKPYVSNPDIYEAVNLPTRKDTRGNISLHPDAVLSFAATLAASAYCETHHNNHLTAGTLPHSPEQQPRTMLDEVLEYPTLRDALRFLVERQYLSPYQEQGLLFIIGYESPESTSDPVKAAAVESSVRLGLQTDVQAAVSPAHTMATLKYILGYPADCIPAHTMKEYLAIFRAGDTYLSKEESAKAVRQQIIRELVYSQTRQRQRSRPHPQTSTRLSHSATTRKK